MLLHLIILDASSFSAHSHTRNPHAVCEESSLLIESTCRCFNFEEGGVSGKEMMGWC
jgi:hypothetical protein